MGPEWIWRGLWGFNKGLERVCGVWRGSVGPGRDLWGFNEVCGAWRYLWDLGGSVWSVGI